MANFRAERLFIRVAGALDFDPNEGIDGEELAFIMICDADAYDRPSLQDFTFTPFDRPRWFPTAEGLATVRKIISEFEAKLDSTDSVNRPQIEKRIEVLRVLEDRLDLIDIKGCKFHLLARDLV